MILVTGSLAFDYIMDFPGVFTDHINPALAHEINVSFLINKLKRGFGGTAGNIAYNLSLLKTPSKILGAVGDDFAPYASFLSQNGVDISHIKTIDGEFTSQAYVMTDIKDNQISAFYPGAMEYNHTLTIAEINPKPELVLITPAGAKAIASYVSQCKNLNIPYLYDPSQQITAIKGEDILEGVNGAKIFISNDYEYEMIKKRLNLSDEDFLKHAEIVIITKGAAGSIIKKAQQIIEIKAAKPQQVLDPTGAGDAYRAAFLAGYLKGLDLKICGQMGSTAACYAVEKYGTTSHTFSLEQFKTRYHENFGDKLNI